MTRACETCEWWGVFPDEAAAPVPRGECRGGPPSATEMRAFRVFPTTYASDWCAAWRMAERLAGGRDARERHTPR